MNKLIILASLIISLNAYSQSEEAMNYSDEIDPVKSEMAIVNRYIEELEEKLKDEPIEAKKVYLTKEMKYETIKTRKKRDMDAIKKAPIQMRENSDIIEIKFDKII